jgi:hypothetical protein
MILGEGPTPHLSTITEELGFERKVIRRMDIGERSYYVKNLNGNYRIIITHVLTQHGRELSIRLEDNNKRGLEPIVHEELIHEANRLLLPKIVEDMMVKYKKSMMVFL